MKIKYVWIFIITLLPIAAKGQKTEKVHGTEVYKVTDSENITLNDAKRRCIELAKAKAIKEKFGELVASESFNRNVENNGELVNSLAWESVVASAKGEWLADIRPAQINVEYMDGSLYFTAEVWGEAREIVQARTDLDWGIVHDGKNGRERTMDLQNGERFYIDFQTPLNGYLAVYMVETDGTVNCLLPDKNHTSGRYPVKASTRYWLFDKEFDSLSRYWKLTTNHETEDFQFVLIFSPKPFAKCLDQSGDIMHANQLSDKIFQTWLLKNQRTDNEMVVEKKFVRVKKISQN